MLNVATTSTAILPTACGHAGGSLRTRRLPRKSMRPAIAASQPTIVPTVTSHAEKSAHVISAVCQYIRSVRSVPTKQAIGIGTRIGWMGWLPMRAVEMRRGLENLRGEADFGERCCRRQTGKTAADNGDARNLDNTRSPKPCKRRSHLANFNPGREAYPLTGQGFEAWPRAACR